MTIRQINLLSDMATDDTGDVIATKGSGQTFQAWLSNAATETDGTATVVVQATNDPRAVSAPSAAAWLTLATFTLDAGGDISDAFSTATTYLWVRASVSAIADDATVTVKMTEDVGQG